MKKEADKVMNDALIRNFAQFNETPAINLCLLLSKIYLKKSKRNGKVKIDALP